MSITFLKLIALLCMIIDHTGEFIPNSPVWFRYVGRLSAPIFFYCSAWGLYYTHNPKKYIARLYFFSLFMSLGNVALILLTRSNDFLTNNIFQTLFLGSTIVYLLNKDDSIIYRAKICILIIIQQIVSFFLCALLSEFLQIPRSLDIYVLYHSYGALFASCIFTEGGIAFVIFYIVIFYLREKKGYLYLFISTFSIFVEVMVRRTYYMRGPISYLIPFNSYQWLMVFCIPIICLYNGKKGIGLKWFFYFIYPFHIWLLFLLSNIF